MRIRLSRQRVAGTTFAALLIIAAGTPALAQGARLLPVDDAPKDPSLLEFRTRLMDAARRQDLDYVLSVLAPHVVNSFGGDEGIEGFKRHWELDTGRTRVWSTLLEVLSMGGTLHVTPSAAEIGAEAEFWAPYVYSRWPNEFDSFEYGAITGEKVKVRSRPSRRAPVVATLSYHIVKMSPDAVADEEAKDQTTSWVKIATPDGKDGYVSSRFLRSPIDYRIGFVKGNGKWLIKTFVAGD
jgi:hypothetical protein